MPYLTTNINTGGSYSSLTDQLKELESKYNKQFKDVYEVINYLLDKEKQKSEKEDFNRIGFKRQNEK